MAALPRWAQARLLDGIQQEPRRRADAGHAAAGVRLIASSTTDLHTGAAQRAVVPSLYHYLAVVEIHVPPLRHRGKTSGRWPNTIRPSPIPCAPATAIATPAA